MTASNTATVEDAFVPTARTWPLRPSFEPGSHFGGPLYRYPSLGEGIVVLAPVALGVARLAIDEFKRLALGKTPFMSVTTLSERPAAQMALGKAEGTLFAARSFFYATAREGWERTLAGQASTKEEKGRLILAAVHLMQSCVAAVDHVCGVAGTSGIYTRSPLECGCWIEMGVGGGGGALCGVEVGWEQYYSALGGSQTPHVATVSWPPAARSTRRRPDLPGCEDT